MLEANNNLLINHNFPKMIAQIIMAVILCISLEKTELVGSSPICAPWKFSRLVNP